VTEKQLAILNDSLERCWEDERFMGLFYERFLSSSPVIEERFEHIDMAHQKRAVQVSVYTAIQAICRRVEDFSFLDEVAERHSPRGEDVPPYLYDLWVESLVSTVRDCDPRYDETVEFVWRAALGVAVDYFLSKR
jgi:hemoglobin-like flavoprotein